MFSYGIHEFFRRGQRRKRVAALLDQSPQSLLNGDVRIVPAIPRQKYIHFMDGCERNVGSIAIR